MATRFAFGGPRRLCVRHGTILRYARIAPWLPQMTRRRVVRLIFCPCLRWSSRHRQNIRRLRLRGGRRTSCATFTEKRVWRLGKPKARQSGTGICLRDPEPSRPRPATSRLRQCHQPITKATLFSKSSVARYQKMPWSRVIFGPRFALGFWFVGLVGIGLLCEKKAVNRPLTRSLK